MFVLLFGGGRCCGCVLSPVGLCFFWLLSFVVFVVVRCLLCGVIVSCCLFVYCCLFIVVTFLLFVVCSLLFVIGVLLLFVVWSCC